MELKNFWHSCIMSKNVYCDKMEDDYRTSHKTRKTLQVYQTCRILTGGDVMIENIENINADVPMAKYVLGKSCNAIS